MYVMMEDYMYMYIGTQCKNLAAILYYRNPVKQLVACI